jgi:pyrrolysyl-tRNA synthetase-like protein
VEKLYWTHTQMARFKELGIDVEQPGPVFLSPSERNRAFQKMEKEQVKIQRKKLTALFRTAGPTKWEILTKKLETQLHQLGFTRVSTPTIITKAALAKMTIDEKHPLFRQIFWINEKQCLRPMLAPGLYSLMADFSRLSLRPVRFYEIGACFRKESDGALHSNEFTMLNLVEMGIPQESRLERLKELAFTVSHASGVPDTRMEEETSEVYGTTLDLVAGPHDVELGSGAMGPHPLDAAWGITDTWVGMGFGIERLLMAAAGDAAIGKWQKSLFCVDGIRLKI